MQDRYKKRLISSDFPEVIMVIGHQGYLITIVVTRA